MISRLDNVKLNISEGEDKLLKIARKKLGKEVKFFKILKKSLDARNKNNINWIYSIAFSSENITDQHADFEKLKKPPRVVIIGSGPAGLMCAVRLIEHGIAPIIVERGECVDEQIGRASCRERV